MKGFDVKTLTIDVQDNFVQDFLNFIQSNKNNIQLHKSNTDIHQDLYFYERQKQLHQIKEQVDNNLANLSTLDEFEIKINNFEKELEVKYAN